MAPSLVKNRGRILKANSHRHARHDKTVLSVSRPLRRCELNSRQLKTVVDGKLGSLNTLIAIVQFTPARHRHDMDRTVLCLAGGVNWPLGTRYRGEVHVYSLCERDAIRSEMYNALVYSSAVVRWCEVMSWPSGTDLLQR